MNPLYYQPSGRFTVVGIILLLLGGLVAAVPLAFAYTYGVWYIPFIYLNFFFTVIFGGLLGWVLRKLVVAGKLRNPALAGLLGALVGVWGWYVQWCVYITLLAGAGEVEEFGSRFSVAHTAFEFEAFLYYLTNPGEVLSILPALAENGTWTLFKVTVSGVFLYLIWLVEFVIIVGFSWLLTRNKAKEPFSEMAGQWAEKVTLPRPAAHFADTTATTAALEAADWNHLQLHPTDLSDTAPHGRLHFYRAPADPDCCYLSLENVTFELDKDGKASEKTADVLEYLRVPPQAFQELNARFSAVQEVQQEQQASS
ncbi:hypothetical protein [Hymenobacter actinosclerus]|uniref:Uncharacterized protein n=1 Tax=Hymenobacter actinosclerus TaxID=82805 RepID=A0A1H9ZVS3_9BACT|nr:hypothetical protein [Hymenobacter actinosclerus]SES84955.1 hypothetical protein SAMN04487998_0462 [Hymenobacter actinosclerus]